AREPDVGGGPRAGRSAATVLNLLAGLLTPDAGTIFVDGAPLDRRRPRIGYVFQKPRLLSWRTVRGNVEFALEAAHVPRAARTARVPAVLALVGLDQFADE